MKIQVDIPPELNKKLKIIRTVNDFKDLKETVIKLLEKTLNCMDYEVNKLENIEIIPHHNKVSGLYREYENK